MKDSLIKGTLILALAAFVARFLGMLIRAPLLYLLGEEGMAAYNAANNIYLLLLIVATAGIPSTLSKLISERLALNREHEAQQIYRAAILFALSTGFVMTILLFVGAPFYANFSEIEESALAIRAIAPAMLLFPLIAIMRGYFQGRQMMKVGGLSQIFEQILRVITAVAAAYMILKLGFSTEWAAAGASLGAVTGSIAAFAVMIFYTIQLRKSDNKTEYMKRPLSTETLTKKKIYAMIFKLSIPISLISMAVPAVNVIDTTITVPLLQAQFGISEAKQMVGILGAKAQSLAGIPPIIAIALSASIIPIVSAAYARKDFDEVGRKTSQTLRISLLSGLPMVLTLAVAARPVNGLLFPNTEGTGMIVIMVAGSMFQILMMTSASILMGIGRTNAPMLHVFAGVCAKLLFSWLLSKWFGIYGIVIATSICFIIILILNVKTLKKIVSFQIFPQKWLGFIGAILVTILAGLAVELGLNRWINTGMVKLDFFVQACLIGLVMGSLYLLLTIRWEAISAEDMAAIPGPLRKILSRLQRTRALS